MFVEHQYPVRRQIVIAGKGIAGKEIVHRLVKLDAQRRVLVVQQEINPGIILLAQAHLDIIRHLEQRMEIAKLAQPRDEVPIKVLMALGADVNGLAQSRSEEHTSELQSR